MNTEIDQTYGALVSLLDDQIRLFRGLLDTVRKEREILVSANLDDLNENNKTKEAMLLKSHQLEADRLKLAESLAQLVGADSAKPRLLDIARYFDGARGDKLRSLHSVLELLVKRIQEHNQQNEVLVKSALENITGAMKAIRDTLQDKPTYQRQGEVTAPPAASGQLVQRRV